MQGRSCPADGNYDYGLELSEGSLARDVADGVISKICQLSREDGQLPPTQSYFCLHGVESKNTSTGKFRLVAKNAGEYLEDT